MTAVDGGNAFAIHADDGVVAELLDFQGSVHGAGDSGAIEDVAVALVEVFKAERLLGFHGSAEVVEEAGGFGEFDSGDLDHRRGGGNFGESFAGGEVLREHLAEGEEFRRGAAHFIDGRVIIIAGGLRLEVAAVIGTAHKAERGAAVDHVVTEGHVVGELPFGFTGEAAEANDGVGFAPMIEPAGVKFRDEPRAVGTVLADFLHNFGSAAAIEAGEGVIRQGTAGHHVAAAIGGEERDFKAGGAIHVADLAHVNVIGAVAAVFIFDLHHDDGAAMGDLQGSELVAEFFQIGAGGREEARVLTADFQIGLLEEPPGVAAEFPFSAAVRSGAEDDPEAFLLGEAYEFGHVGIAGEIKFAFAGFELVPKYVNGNRVQPHGVHHAQAVGPVFVGDAGRMHFAGLDLKRFAIEQKGGVADGKRVVRGGGGGGRECQPAGGTQGERPPVDGLCQ